MNYNNRDEDFWADHQQEGWHEEQHPFEASAYPQEFNVPGRENLFNSKLSNVFVQEFLNEMPDCSVDNRESDDFIKIELVGGPLDGCLAAFNFDNFKHLEKTKVISFGIGVREVDYEYNTETKKIMYV